MTLKTKIVLVLVVFVVGLITGAILNNWAVERANMRELEEEYLPDDTEEGGG